MQYLSQKKAGIARFSLFDAEKFLDTVQNHRHSKHEGRNLFPDKGALLTSPYLCLKPPLWKRHEENECGCNNREKKNVFNA